MSLFLPQAEPKIADLRTLFINFHHALNEYRPHQARESLIALMQDQLDRKRAETQANRAAADSAARVLEGLASLEVPSPPAPRYSDGDDGYRTGEGHGGSGDDYDDGLPPARGREVWAAMDAGAAGTA